MSIGRNRQHGAQHGGSCLFVVEQSRGENKMADAHIKQMVRPSPASHTRFRFGSATGDRIFVSASRLILAKSSVMRLTLPLDKAWSSVEG